MNSWWNWVVEEELRYFRDYLDLINEKTELSQKSIETREQELRTSGAQAIETEFGIHDPYEDLAEDMYKANEMRQLMLSTFTIGIFIFIETQINKICSELKSERNILFSHKDISGNGITRSVKYLKKVLGKDFPYESETKNDFEVARVIRNSLVHANGIIAEEKLPLIKKFIENNPSTIELSQYNTIKLSDKYAESLILLSRKLCDELEKHLPSSYPF